MGNKHSMSLPRIQTHFILQKSSPGQGTAGKAIEPDHDPPLAEMRGKSQAVRAGYHRIQHDRRENTGGWTSVGVRRILAASVRDKREWTDGSWGRA